MSVDLKTLTPDTTLPQSGLLFGADSQASTNPSVYPVANVKDALNSGIGTLASTPTTLWDVAVNPVASLTLTQNTTLYVSNFKAGGTYRLIVFQDATGSRTLSYDGNIQWPNGSAPTITSTAYAMTELTFVSDGVYMYGSVVQPYNSGPYPTVSGIFATPAFDYSTLSTTSTMPTGGSISRAGNAMLYDSTGQLTYAPNNLLTYSNTFNAGTWAGVNSVMGANSLTDNTTNGSHSVQFPTVGFAQGVRSFLYVEAQASSLSQIMVFSLNSEGKGVGFDLSNGTTFTVGGVTLPATYGIINIGSGWYGCWISVTPTSTSASSAPGAIYACSGGAYSYAGTGQTVNLRNASFSAVTYETAPRSGDQVITTSAAYYGPRFDYDPVTLQPKGLLVEGQLQQLLSWSEDFRDTAAAGSTRPWSWARCTVSANTTTSPDGNTTADSLIEDTTTNSHPVYQTISGLLNATSYTISCFIKAAGRTQARIALSNTAFGTGPFVNFDLSAVTATPNTTGVSGSITPVGNGWYRCSISVVSSAAGNGDLYIQPLVAGAATYLGNGAVALYLFGAQLEARAFPTSYLPTQGGTSPFATRAAETFALTGYANRLVEAFYIDEETGGSYSGNSALSTGTVTISPPTFGWVTSLRAYTNAYAGSISSPSWLSFSGTTGLTAGNRTYYDSTGTLTYAPANFLLRSYELQNNSAWTKQNTATVLDGQSDRNGLPLATQVNFNAQYGNVFQSVTASSGGTFIVSFWAKLLSGNSSLTLMNSVNGTLTYTPITVTSGWQQFFVVCAAASGNSLLVGIQDRNASGFGNTLVSDMQIEPVTYQTAPSAYIPTTSAAVYGPRYDYDPSTVPATPRGLLIEEQRVNIVTASSAFTNAGPFWYQNDSPSATTTNLAPDGTATAYSWSFNTASTGYYGILTFAADVTYAFSVYVKNISGSGTVRLGSDSSKWGGGANTLKARVDFNPSTGVFSNVQSGVIAYDKQNVGNGWWRIWFTATKNSTAETTDLTVYAVSAGTYAFWGYQVEHAGTAGTPTSAPFITSLIPTTTASVTRAADVAQLTGSALTTLQGATGTVFAETRGINASAGLGRIVSGQSPLGFLVYDGATQVASWNGSTNITATLGGGGTFSSNARTGISWSNAPSRTIVGNNGTLSTPSATTFGAVTAGYIGTDTSTGSWASGWYRSFAAYNQKLPDTILKQKSTVGAPY